MSDTEAMINVVPQQPPPDPDAATTVHDFLDYTEYLHSDVARSLRLIGRLDHEYQKSTNQLDALCIKYGELRRNQPDKVAKVNGNTIWPYSINEQDMGAFKLRLSIARKLNGAVHAREETSAESARLYDNIDRHFNKLSSALTKLQQIPLPDREPTPKPAPAPEPDAQPRITLRVADRFTPRAPFGSLTGRRRRGATYGMSRAVRRPTGRRDDAWEDLPDGERSIRRRGRRPGVGFQPKPLPPPPLTETGEPVDPLSLPWNRLMPHELARLRKRMKKNTQWTPSTTMILRELESLGRGIANKDKFLHQTESGDYPHCSPEDGGIGSLATENNLFTTENRGMKLNAAKRRLKEAQALAAGRAQLGMHGGIDRDTKMEDSVVVGSKPSAYGGKSVTLQGQVTSSSTNSSTPQAPSSSILTKGPARGKDPEAMNDLKLRTTSSTLTSPQPVGTNPIPPSSPAPLSPPLASPPSLQVVTERLEPEPEQAQPSASASPSQASISPPHSNLSETPPVRSLPAIAGHKRKRSVASPAPGPSSPPAVRNTKGLDTAPSLSNTPASPQSARKQGSAPASTPGPCASSDEPTSPVSALQAPEIVAHVPPPPVEPVRRRGRPPGTFKIGSARRKAQMAKLGARAEKEHNAISVTTPAVAERKQTKKGEEGDWEEDMEVNEHEPRYCLCNGVSHGLMLGCENDECDLEWFHLECLGLTTPPPRKVPWFCPRCREGGENGNPTLKASVGVGKGALRGGQRKKRRKFK